MERGRVRRGLRRTWVVLTKAPLLADHRGLRWLLNGRVMPGGPLVVLTHRGRLSGRTYRTPAEVIAEDEVRGEIFVLPARGEQSDWYRNLVAGGLMEVRLRGEGFAASCRRLSEEESAVTLGRYASAHPRWSRSILKSLARHHGLQGDPLAAVAKAMPILALKRAMPASDGPA